jgi:hypothetical protein
MKAAQRSEVISVLAGDALFFFLDAGAMNLSTKGVQ